MIFSSAAEVRKYLKDKGFDTKGMKIRFCHNPFGGEGKFVVTPKIPDGIAIATSSNSAGTKYFSDNPATSHLFASITKELRDTNAFAGM